MTAYPEYERIPASIPRLNSTAATNLPVVEESNATGEVADLYDRFCAEFGRPEVPGILKCFATHPPLLRSMMDLAQTLLFAEGHLTRRHKEMIAVFVSVRNRCPYCTDSHGYFLRVHGGSQDLLCAVQQNDLHSPALTAAERALLHFADLIRHESQSISRTDIDELSHTGWSTSQIAEAVHIAALFAMFNRVANAFGLHSQGLLTLCDERPIPS
jgi:uncharacterized peroxidase-related enzyme